MTLSYNKVSQIHQVLTNNCYTGQKATRCLATSNLFSVVCLLSLDFLIVFLILTAFSPFSSPDFHSTTIAYYLTRTRKVHSTQNWDVLRYAVFFLHRILESGWLLENSLATGALDNLKSLSRYLFDLAVIPVQGIYINKLTQAEEDSLELQSYSLTI